MDNHGDDSVDRLDLVDRTKSTKSIHYYCIQYGTRKSKLKHEWSDLNNVYSTPKDPSQNDEPDAADDSAATGMDAR